MLINNNSCDGVVKFISYSGRYPNLCSGTLILEIDGETVCFDYPKFWRSGGVCGFRNSYNSAFIDKYEWMIDVAEIPEPYKKYAREIDSVFNENVSYGCCGGCL